MAFDFTFVEVKFQDLKNDIDNYIKDIYNKSDENLSPADPYGHILQAVETIFSTTILYLKNVVAQFDINNPDNNNAKMVYALARIAGHNPSRALSATGTISLKVKPGIDIAEEIPGSKVLIRNFTKLTSNTNSLEYYIELGTEQISLEIQHNKEYDLPIVQGRPETQTFTGTGDKNQSFSVNLPGGRTPEEFRVAIRVDGEIWTRRDHLWDLLPDEKAYYVRTGIEGGLDVYFGTGNFGRRPLLGDNIEIFYINSDGSLGNIPHKQTNDFTFTDEIFDNFGGSLDVESLFDIFIKNEISLGADAENTVYTKALLPFTSRNFLLARPAQYEFQLRRLNQFSQIDAFTTEKGTQFDNEDPTDDSVVYLFLVPNIQNFIGNGGGSYFDIAEEAFIIEDDEKRKIEQYLRTQGTMTLGSAVKFIDPIVMRYIMNLYIRIFNDAIVENVRSQILSKVSDYFVNIERRGRIPKSDIIRIVEDIDGVDSVNVTFLSKENEDYHRDYIEFKREYLKSNARASENKILQEYNKALGVENTYLPNRVIGLDSKLGDIVYKKNELPIIRGGWSTRDGSKFFNETPSSTALSSVNIIIDPERSSKKIFT